MWRSKRAKSIASAVVVLLAVSSGSAVASHGVQAKKAKKPDLVVTAVTGSVTGRTATVSATVTNAAAKKKGKKSKATTVAFVLSADTTAGAGDTALGSVPVAKLKPKKSATAASTFAVPAATAAGSYYLVACVDPGGVIKEKKEQNNCSAGAAKVTLAPVVPATVTVTYSSTFLPFSNVTGTATNGTCVANPATGGGVCTVTAGVGTVVLTPTSTGPAFGGMYTAGTSGPCDGVENPTTYTMTFTAPTTNKSCVATFA
jgi:trimeric autotransporter adhesin